jgi:RNA-directed DNA polymerase
MALEKAEASVGMAPSAGLERNCGNASVGAEVESTAVGQTKSEGLRLMEAVVERGNMRRAYERVVSNRGAAGVDEMTVAELKGHLKIHWPVIRARLLAGEYCPQAVRKVEIPKPQGGMRTLGIPTVVDRLIQQGLNQVLQGLFDSGFSESSYGFRPGRSAHDAVRAAQGYIRAGRKWVVDIDLEKFFDRVNHDLVMLRVANKVEDTRVLKLIRRYLQAGMMQGGVVTARGEGTPQGGPLSPLLSNILLSDLDRELERRGHAFCRYADDCNIYVRSERSGERVMASVSRFVQQRLKLTVNAAKSAVAKPWERKFLGFSFTGDRESKLRIAASSVERFKARVREALVRSRGGSVERSVVELATVLTGWIAYFGITQSKRVLEELDGWIRRKLRCRLWRQWKRVHTRAKRLMSRGLTQERAWRSATNGRGPWWNAGASHMNAAFRKSYFDRMGLVSLLDSQRRFQRVS